MTMRTTLLAAGVLLTAAPALAADPASPADPLPSEVRLTPEQIEQVLADAAKKRESGPSLGAEELQSDKPPLPIHGKVGVTVGTGGYRAIYGGATIGLSEDSFASFSFEDQSGGDRFRRRNHR